jgi:hypothetical protein
MSKIISKLWNDIFKQSKWDAEGFARSVEDWRKAKKALYGDACDVNYTQPKGNGGGGSVWTMTTTTTTRAKPTYHPARSGKRWK